MTAAPQQQGFTLLELLVVVAILGLVASLAAPSVRTDGGPGVVIRTAVSQTVVDLIDARESAMRKGAAVCVRLVDAAQVGLQCRPLVLDPAVSLAAGTSRSIRFHADGSNSGARIVLTAGALRRTVIVVGATGQILLP